MSSVLGSGTAESRKGGEKEREKERMDSEREERYGRRKVMKSQHLKKKTMKFVLLFSEITKQKANIT